VPSAQYWIGNSYYALRDFKNAITAQEKLLSSYGDSAKAPDAMLNIASSHQEMNKKTAAKKTLETLIGRYPGSDAAEKAKRRLANLK
jgi:tol-pal system protein YbgF